MNIPTQMQGLQLNQYASNLSEVLRDLSVATLTVPIPEPGQVLVKVEAAPCNPSDLIFLQGKYGVKKTLPTVPGWEGSGTVIASGGGIMSYWLNGKRVAFAVQANVSGTWAEYCVVDAYACIPLDDDISFEQGASLIINPLSAIGMMETASEGGHKAIIQTAAASQLGRMINAIAHLENIPIINIVRREEQVSLLRQLGAEYVLNSSNNNYYVELKALAAQLNATIAFDAIGGPQTGKLLHAMPKGSSVFVYGALSEEQCSDINPLDLIFGQKQVKGFWLTTWLSDKSLLGTLMATKRVQRLVREGVTASQISQRVSLQEAPAAIEAYSKEMTRGKVIIRPHD